MGFMKFLCCLIPGRCDHEAPDAEQRTSAASAGANVRPNAPEPQREPPSSGEPDELPGGPS
jgi:hypothetical protein